MLMLCDDEGGIVRYNATTERLTRRPDDERVWGRPFWEVLRSGSRPRGVEICLKRDVPSR